jgi:hypothetical protein
MSRYERKTVDWFYIMGVYEKGEEELTVESSMKDARQRLREYRENEPQYRHRIKERRLPKGVEP